MKKTAILLIVFSVATLVGMSMPFVLAKHDREIFWVPDAAGSATSVAFDYIEDGILYPRAALAPSSAEMYHKPYGKPIVFAVKNTGADDNIIAVEVIVNQTIEGYAQFKLERGRVTKDKNGNETAEGWGTRIVEVDGKGWVRVYRFETTDATLGIEPGKTFYFWLYFSDGKTECTYKFTVWTHDFGLKGPQESKAYPLWLVMDPHAPVVKFTPANDATVEGLPLPCGNHYFAIDITAYDNPTCPSKIQGTVFNVSVTDAKKQPIWSRIGIIKNDTGPDYKMYYFSGNDTWIAHFEVRAYNTTNELPQGYYNISVTVKDRVGNAKTEVHKIKYVPPPIPVFTASPNTWIKDPKIGLVESEQVVYKNKVLGSSVTLTETGFKSGTKVEFRIYIPTYIYYNKTYGTFNVLVNYTKAAADGSATAKFIFPKAPQGTYTVFITGLDPAGTPLTKYKTVAVTCEVIFNPDEIIGPAVINVMATGLLHPETTQPGYQLASLLIREQSWENPKDALMGVNSHISWNWYVDANGTLQTSIAGGTGIKVDPGFSMPILQPGTYEITILIQGTFYRWQCVDWSQPPLTYTSQTNTIKVKDWTGDILNAANAAKTAAEGAKSSADAAKSSADAAKSSADAAKSSADAAKSSADAAKSSADAAKSSADAAKSSADAAKNSADAAKSSADSAATGIDAAKNAAQGLTIPVYLAVIFSLIAAIIAAACAILVYRKIA